MHASSYENMQLAYRRFLAGTELEERGGLVLDVGGSDVNGSYRALFKAGRFKYMAADLEAGPGVDIVLEDPYVIPMRDGMADIIVSGQAFEHIEFFWRTFAEMARVLNPDGIIFLIAPSGGPEHRFPVDCYRFLPDAYRALAKSANLDLVDVWRDERGPWQDLVGVFRHKGASPLARARAADRTAPFIPFDGEGLPDEERLSGKAPYLDVLARFHKELSPSSYFEIGVRHGRSLALASAPAIGVDPAPEISVELGKAVQVVTAESDAYFASHQQGDPIDFAFIDGLHTFEQTLRDFMQVERRARPGAALLIDDIFPNHQAQAERQRRTRAWTGDVWKLIQVLRTHRPDLFLLPLDTHPSGMLLVAGLDPHNRVLWDRYNPIVREYIKDAEPPAAILAREGASDPSADGFTQILATLADCYRRRAGSGETASLLRERAAALRPKLSVIVIAYNMAREIPRTIRSLSPAMQRGIAASDYEIILIDNGSTQAFDREALLRLSANLTIHTMSNATVSPVPAINRGLELARGDLIGVCIDGARMASPGLLAGALAASRLHERPVIGTIAFHLGPEVQMQSVQKGYDAATEDALLRDAAWEEDAYRLFDISVFAGSSSGGWFETPAETNALFMKAAHWRALGGYDAGFKTQGGGLANLDTWKRACDDPEAALIMLLGEATFHQVHGGIATNSTVSKWELFHEEYMRLRGKPFEKSTRAPRFYGTVTPRMIAAMRSAAKA
ncbi:MAG: class I SAM-dependent methyltransferase [Alphaproteobacteria bacterium]|nr:class I SAM-dependent methyltransferase [Alphaproteobacteria bacterium]